MSELRMFYRMLGIAENIIEPSFYHLLGLDRKDCNSQTVAEALLRRKNELRQHAPGPEFVPQIIAFEKEHLEPAAEVLADEVRRAKYDKVLAARWKKVKNETDKRARLIGAVRLAVTNAIDSNGALNASGKESLAEKLKSLGVEQHNVDAILAKIPAPLFETGEHESINVEFFNDSVGLAAGKGGLDESDKTKLFALAERLKIDKDQAGETIKGARTKDDFVIEDKYLDDGKKQDEVVVSEESQEPVSGQGSVDVDAGDAGKIKLVNDILDNKETDGKGSGVETEETEVRGIQAVEPGSGKGGIGFKYAVMLAILLLAGISVYLLFFRDNGSDKQEEPKSSSPGNSHVNNPGSSGVTGQEPGSSGDNSNEPGNKGSSGTGEYKYTGGGGEDILDVTADLSAAAKKLVVKDFAELSVEELLADTVVAMAASCGRACELSWESHLWNSEINKMLSAENTASVIASRVVLDGGKSELGSPGEVAAADDEVLRKLEEGLSSSDKHVRYNAIERLRNDGSRRAVEILLGEGPNGLSGSKQTISRRLRALNQINEPYIAGLLAERLGVITSPRTAQGICLALADMTGTELTEALLLKPKNNINDRKICSEAWMQVLEGWGGRTKVNAMPLVEPRIAEETLVRGKLYGAAGFYCGAISGELEAVGYTDGTGSERAKPASLQNDKIRISANAEDLFAQAAGRLRFQLEGVVRKRPGSDEFSDKLKFLRDENLRRKFTSKTMLQSIEADLDSSGKLLELLAELTYPDGRFDKEIKRNRSDRDADIQRAGGVLEKIRQHSFYNLRLFDMLVQEIDDSEEFSRAEMSAKPYTSVVAESEFKKRYDQLLADQRTEKNRQLSLLTAGLEAFLEGRLDVAGGYFGKIGSERKFAEGVFDTLESAKLKDLESICEGVSAGQMCEACGGTKVDDCRSCSGVGWDICNRCKGTGRIDTGRREVVCGYCGGLSMVKCDKCQGKGLVECDGIEHDELTRITDSIMDDVQRALTIALYLKGGGGDVYSK